MLKALIASDFVLRYVPFGCSKREVHYKLVDPFCIFYLRYVKENSIVNMCEMKFYGEFFYCG